MAPAACWQAPVSFDEQLDELPPSAQTQLT
jgi:hypothetical protein